jgi:ribonuclease PH
MSFTRSYTEAAIGSVLAACGKTLVLCTVSYTDQVPQWLVGSASAWLTAEYSMLPGSTAPRKPREARANRVDARSMEIQRLIGRSLRSVIDLKLLPEITLWVDCDVLAADGSTRTTSINGAYVALYDALLWLEQKKIVRKWPLRTGVAAVSVGIVDGATVVDLDYNEDSRAEVDLSLVGTDDGRFIEVQGSAERTPFNGDQLQQMLGLGQKAIAGVQELQRKVLGLAPA